MDAIHTLKIQLENSGLLNEVITLKRYEFLKKPGSIDTHIYFVIHGSLRVFFINNCEEHILYFGFQKSLITALDSFLSEKKSDICIQALKKTTLYRVSKKEFLQFIKESGENQKLWQQVLEELLYLKMERSKDLLISSPLKRYRRALKRTPQLFQEIPHKYIASYLRMTAETMSRIQNS